MEIFFFLKGGPSWNVPTGRRDGVISNASEALQQIPAPTSNFTTLQNDFAAKGLDLKDLVLLSGAWFYVLCHFQSRVLVMRSVMFFVVLKRRRT